MKNKYLLAVIILLISTILNFVFISEYKIHKKEIKYYNKYLKFTIDHYENEINRLVNHYEGKDYVSTDTIEWSVIVGDWEFTKDSIQYIGKKDTVFVVNLDSLQSKWKYYRVIIDN